MRYESAPLGNFGQKKRFGGYVQFHEEVESGPDYYGEMIQARKEVEEMTTKFAELMELQQKKLQEAEKRYNETLKGKRVSTSDGMNVDGKNIIRIKDFKISGSISSEKNRLLFSSLSKQIESALQKGYSEADIIDGVINAVSPSLHLKDLFGEYKITNTERA